MSLSPWDSQNVILQELLTNVRNDAQLTQKQLATLIGKPQSYVSKYETGERRLILPEIRKIAICCGSDLKMFVAAFEKEINLIGGNDES